MHCSLSVYVFSGACCFGVVIFVFVWGGLGVVFVLVFFVMVVLFKEVFCNYL